MKKEQFAPRRPQFGLSDVVRLAVVCSLGGYVFVNRAVLERLGPTRPITADQPWIESPSLLSTVPAGIVRFSGTAPTGARVEVVEKGRIVGEAWARDGKWTIMGKMFGPGPTSVRARVIGGTAKRSPVRHLTVSGRVEPVVSLTNPLDGDALQPGLLTVKGQGKPGDELYISYNNVILGKAVPGEDHRWTKVIQISEPKKEGYLKVVSKAECETVLVFLRGHS